VQVRLAVPVPLAVRLTLVEGIAMQLKPNGTVSSNDTAPTKFSVLVKVIVDVNEAPALPLGELAVIVKSPTCTEMTVELVTVGLPPDPMRETE